MFRTDILWDKYILLIMMSFIWLIDAVNSESNINHLWISIGGTDFIFFKLGIDLLRALVRDIKVVPIKRGIIVPLIKVFWVGHSKFNTIVYI